MLFFLFSFDNKIGLFAESNTIAKLKKKKKKKKNKYNKIYIKLTLFKFISTKSLNKTHFVQNQKTSIF